MRIRGISVPFDQVNYPLVSLGFFEGETKLKGVSIGIDNYLTGLLSEILASKEFENDRISILHSRGKIRRILAIGLGKQDEYTPDVLRSAAGKVTRRVRELELTSFGFVLDQSNSLEDVQALVEGSELGLYNFDKYKSSARKPEVKEMGIFLNKRTLRKSRDIVAKGQIIARSVALTRDLSNLPSSDCTPSILSSYSMKLNKRGKVKVKVIEQEQMRTLGFGGVLAVARGSHEPAKFIILEYAGDKIGRSPIVLVGKAITFDSGGISIKPSEKMNEMKHDKSGGATVIGVIKAAAELKIPLNLVGLVPATENLPGGGAYKPGDVVRFHNGKTAEILNTDAEGRLILADALAYAQRYKPQAIIDFATLTGACIIALGNVASGLMGNHPIVSQRILDAADRTGERVWELPLWKEYKDQIKSDIADIKNTSGRAGGTITAAAFLSNFVGDYPWAHLDIAGTAWTQDATPNRGYNQKGATGVGVRLAIDLLHNWKPLS
ncbi:MAG: leucyl aminopeptidase [Nitrososphaerales archaeon]